MTRCLGRGWVGPALAGALVAAGATSAGAAGLRVVDGGTIDFSPAKRAAALAAARAVTPMQLVPLTQKVTLYDRPYNSSGPLTIDFTSDTVSMLLYMEPRPADGRIWATVDPRRPEEPVHEGADNPATSFVLPASDMPVVPGKYTFEVAATSDAAEVIVVQRRGPQPRTGTVDVNFFDLAGSGLDQGALQQAFPLFADVFGKAGIRIGSVALYTVTGAEDLLSVPDSTGGGSPLRQIPVLSNFASNTAAINIFFVREIFTQGGVIFGISMGLPAALTIPGTISSGVVVNVSAHQTAGGFDVSNFGQTFTHETGHSLGLRHSSERSGAEHDWISDTPECPGPSPTRAEACPDGQNFMFWSGLAFDITPGQAYVMLRSPVVR